MPIVRVRNFLWATLLLLHKSSCDHFAYFGVAPTLNHKVITNWSTLYMRLLQIFLWYKLYNVAKDSTPNYMSVCGNPQSINIQLYSSRRKCQIKSNFKLPLLLPNIYHTRVFQEPTGSQHNFVNVYIFRKLSSLITFATPTVFPQIIILIYFNVP